MKSDTRKVVPNIINHCYQNTPDGFLLFYNVSDFLVFFTLYCVVARRHPVRVVKLCLMPDHIHESVIASSKRELSAFVKDYSSRYSLVHNRICHSAGPVFRKHYGSVPKIGDKKARTHFIYLDNNAVERKLVKRAEQYRWNFIAYAKSDHPYSEKLVLRRSRYPLQKAVRLIRRLHQTGRYLPYELLQKLFAPLTLSEKEQLTDFIVSTYSVIDHDYCIRFFDTYEQMLISTHANTGSEYDLNEVNVGKTDAVYPKITRILMKTGRFKDIHDVLALPTEARMELFIWLLPQTEATPAQVAKYLHLRLA